ncbi:Longitudinals lacking protein-like [Gryllus bimaculatus]|nr:Longitudinals lacking protein-like [Gryllus bimaculatus]
MAESVLSVSWNDHANELATVWKTLLENNSFVDCTIAAEGQSVKAHRLILSACSPYFRKLFSEEVEKYPIIILKDTLFDTLKTVIDFVYYGKAEIPENQLEAFLELAVSLQIKGLNNSLRKDKKTDIGGHANGNTHQCASDVNEDDCDVEGTCTNQEDSSSNSSQSHLYPLSHVSADTTQMDSCVPQGRDSDSCDKVQSDTAVMPLQDHNSHLVPNEPDVALNSEISVKREPLYSKMDVFGTKNKILGHQNSPVNNDPEVFINTEKSVKCEPLYSEIAFLDAKKDDVTLDESISENFGRETNKEPDPSFAPAVDQYSCSGQSGHVKENLALAIPLQQQQPLNYQLQQQIQHQQQMQQQYQYQQQQVARISCELPSSPSKQLDSLQPERLVTKSERTYDQESEESMGTLDVPGNDMDEIDKRTESTIEQNLNPCRSAEYILPDEDEATERGRGQRLLLPHESNNSFPTRPKLPEPNAFPAPSEQQYKRKWG